jgi:hypothetical protein
MNNPPIELEAVVNVSLSSLSIGEVAALNLWKMLNGLEWDQVPESILGASKLGSLRTGANGEMQQDTKLLISRYIDRRVQEGK